MKTITGGVCAAKGFKASGVHCGIRKNRTKKDLALIYSETVATAAATYTTNLVKGAPLTVTKNHIADGKAQAVICNSGNANTCNANGIEVAEKMCELLAKELDVKANDVVVKITANSASGNYNGSGTYYKKADSDILDPVNDPVDPDGAFNYVEVTGLVKASDLADYVTLTANLITDNDAVYDASKTYYNKVNAGCYEVVTGLVTDDKVKGYILLKQLLVQALTTVQVSTGSLRMMTATIT